MKFTENMLHLNRSYPTFELPPKSRRPAPWARHGPYYARRNDRTLQNHARTFILLDSGTLNLDIFQKDRLPAQG